MSEPPATGATQQDPRDGSDQSGAVSNVSEPDLRPIERADRVRPVESKREDARKNIAYALLALVIAQVVFFAFAVFGSAETWERAQEFMQVTLAGTLGLLGSAVGFYFGSQRQ